MRPETHGHQASRWLVGPLPPRNNQSRRLSPQRVLLTAVTWVMRPVGGRIDEYSRGQRLERCDGSPGGAGDPLPQTGTEARAKTTGPGDAGGHEGDPHQTEERERRTSGQSLRAGSQGISGKLTRRGACICISTAFEGKYLDSYYLDLVLGSNPRIERHSIPAFIPLDQIANTHLQADLKKFLVLLFQHLNAYAGRKYQAEQLQALPLIATPGTLQKNSLYTLLTFEYNLDVEGADVCFCAKVLYGDLTRVLPTEVHITCKDPAQSLTDTISSHSKLFYKKPLHQALDYLKSANETLVHTSASLSGAGLF
uniref:Centromere protein O n=1 Tax=Leptobrachium leishanense TaxID=445787 RepID=A0A8C5PFV8_9ANUR